MSQNDIIALEAHYENWQADRVDELPDGVKPWVYYCVDQFLKLHRLSDEELLYGITDRDHNGGVDAFYFFINGVLVREDTTIDTKAINPKVDLVLVQVQAKGSFSPLEVNKQERFADDLLALSEPASKFASKYHPDLIKLMRIFKEKYLRIAGNFPAITTQFFYICNIDDHAPDANVLGAIDEVRQVVAKHFSSAVFEYESVNVQGILTQAQVRASEDKPLTWAEAPMQTAEGYVGLVNLPDYQSFITTNHGTLADNMFEANVRGYQGDATVNKQIQQALVKNSGTNFWILNNGITIIASEHSTAGHLQIGLKDPQIVNGLQTSREIFNYFSTLTPKERQNEQRKILVRVIVTPDLVVQDSVIRATNSQTKLPEGALRTTEPLHHSIEDLFKQAGLYYDRRKGFYKDQGKPIGRIVSVTQLIQAIVSILLRSPYDARWRPSDYLTKDDNYRAAFNEDLPLSIYVQVIQIMRKVQTFVRTLQLTRSEKFNLKLYIAMLLISRESGMSNPSAEDILAVNISDITEDAIASATKQVLKLYNKLAASEDEKVRGSNLQKRLEGYIRRSLAQQKREEKNAPSSGRKRAGRVQV